MPARKPKQAPAKAGTGKAAPSLTQLFRLTEVEVRLLELLLTAPEPLTLGAVRERLSVADADLSGLLLPDGPLRAHALVEVDAEAELGLLRDTDRLHAARGLRQVFSGGAGLDDVAVMEGQAPGSEYLAAPAAETAWANDLGAERPSPAITELMRDHLVAQRAPLLWLSYCAPDALAVLGRALGVRLLRPVLLISAPALSGWPQAQLQASLRRLRRDADLRGAAVLCSEVQVLGESWRALCAPRPLGQSAPVVLAGSAALPAPRAAPRCRRTQASLAVRAAELYPPAAPGNAAPASRAAEDEVMSASREEARRKAAMDAARAMGKPIPADLAKQAPAPARVAAPPPSPPPPRVEPSPPPAPVAEAPAAEPVAEAPAPAEAGTAPPAESVAAAEAPPIPLSPDAPLDEVARVARTTPNAQQRVELLLGLAGKRSPAVILAFRQNLGSAHPAVRAAAEAGMASLFGPEWNRSRPIPPPVQPPRSDDHGKGPGGAF